MLHELIAVFWLKLKILTLIPNHEMIWDLLMQKNCTSVMQLQFLFIFNK